MKKCVFVLAIALFSAVGAQGAVAFGTDSSGNSEVKAESWNWPATYDFQDIAVIPVKMDVGFWIKVNGAKDLVLKLKQVEIHKYSGTVNVTIACNVNIQLSVSWSKKSDVNLGSYGSSVSVSPSTLDAPGGTVAISLTLSNVDLSNLAGGANCLEIGAVTLKVRPNMTPQLAGGCR